MREDPVLYGCPSCGERVVGFVYVWYVVGVFACHFAFLFVQI